MASDPIPFRLPDAMVERLDALAEKLGLKRSDIVRLSLLRVLEVAETNPAALMQYTPELLAMDGRRSKTMTEAARVADDGRASMPKTPPKKVDYRKAVKADARKRRREGR